MLKKLIFLVENSILFDKKKTICITFGSKVKERERGILDSSDLLWTDNVVYLGNFINSACNDDVNFHIKKYFFIGYVNKLMTNYGRLQTHVLINVFKSYCCFFMVRIYGISSLLDLINAANPGI